MQRLPGVHVSDLAALYVLIVERFLRGESLPNGKQGYYFALSHDVLLAEFGDHLAKALQARGLVTDSEPGHYSDVEAVVESMGVPLPFAQLLWASGYVFIALLVLVQAKSN